VSDVLDDDRLLAVLLDGARADFTACFDRVGGETVYAVALVVPISLGSVYASVATEQGLDAVVERRSTNEPARPRADLRRGSQFLLCESPHWAWASRLPGLVPATDLLGARWAEAMRLADEAEAAGEDGDAVAADWDARTMAVILRALQTLDHEGLFGAERPRERIHVGIEMPTSVEELLELSEALNPPALHARYAGSLVRPARLSNADDQPES
jgi:hypothetical protein